ncbi:microtubule-associated protein futsch isoform X3 [Zerene cesonia]|uniref:microtubule-associated protein futsch isoform X3 n=1 Tax=Zerene cesonia TaxID=33412 RepID=UPI0018E57698|nr:microtubule-associated protein futsch isoform X3 [Zerene cesonia]
MESSEEDAGTATNASRRESAREKDLGQLEDVNATSSFQQDTFETRTSCQTPAMSEDNFDGDSVPSPSTQDVNTSTEAILDMIDEIVDGPGAPKRLPLLLDTDAKCLPVHQEDRNTNTLVVQTEESSTVLVTTPVATAAIEETQSSSVDSAVISTECTENTGSDNLTLTCELPKPNSPICTVDTISSVDNEEASSSEKLPSSPLPNIPTSSVNKTEQSVSDSENGPCERTVKCVTSSDSRDKVVVESAESTSSDISASEEKTLSIEPVTRSPLRRRLVRPALSRPDSTVSSTVDSSIRTEEPEQSSECITKDVSSSSDAVSTVRDSVKSEEIRNVSEISICKAETSTSPPKKIRLIRQKINPQVNHTDNLEFDKQSSITDSGQCQSTSTESATNQKDITPLDVTIESTPTVNLQSNEDVISTDLLQNIEQKEVISGNQEDCSLTASSLEVSEISNQQEIKKDIDQSSLSAPVPPERNESEPVIESSPKQVADEELKNESSSNNVHPQNEEQQNTETEKTVPKLTIKVTNKSCDDPKSPIPKLTIKPLKATTELDTENLSDEKVPIPSITKLNIKPIPKPPEKINELHRKSSSSEISESEYSENDDSASTSDQASASDHGPQDVVPRVTIKLGKPGTETEGKFYTEPNIPKLTIKGIQNSNEEGRESPSKLKVIICQSEENQVEKVPKLTIKSVSITDGQPLSPKLTIKSLKPPDSLNRENTLETSDPPPIPKLKISTDSSNTDLKDLSHVPKITIKPLTKPDNEMLYKTPKKALSENLENIPVITKLNIKPIIKPENSIDVSNKNEDKVPVVSKINIKPIVNPNEIDLSEEDIPKVTKLNIKPIKSPEGNSSKETGCDDVKSDENIPIVTKLNIKPIVKPSEVDMAKESENHSSETGTSSDENNDHIPIVTKINIKPICKPNDKDDVCVQKEDNIPVITKLNIKPLVKPDYPLPLSPKKERTSSPELRNQSIPVVTKLNIKPILKPEDIKQKVDTCDDTSVKNPPLLMRINRKTRTDSGSSDTQYHINKNDNEHSINNINEHIPAISKLNIKPVLNPETESLTNVPEKKINTIQNDSNHSEYETHNPPAAIVNSDKELKSISNSENKDNIDRVLTHCIEESKHEECISNEVKPSSPFSGDIIKQNTNVSKNVSDDKCIKDLSSESRQTVVGGPKSPSNQRGKSMSNKSNCTLLKKLLESHKNDDGTQNVDSKINITNCISTMSNEGSKSSINDTCSSNETNKSTEFKYNKRELSPSTENIKEIISGPNLLKVRSMQDLCKEMNESVTKPLEINISDKINQSSDQDSPRIILKINKTDHGASAKIITEEMLKSDNKNAGISDSMVNKRRSMLNSRKKPETESPNVVVGKRLRSSRVVQSPEKSPFNKRSIGKRSSNTETLPSPASPKESELSMLDTKRLKLGQLLSNKSLSITPVVAKSGQVSPPTNSLEMKQSKIVNHSLLNNENCSKNGSSKLHNILSNLQSKQLKVMPLNDLHHSERKQSVSPELKSGTSLDGNPNVRVEISPVEQNCSEMRETIFHENVESRDFNITPDPLSQDPLEVGNLKPATDFTNTDQNVPKIVEMTPQPKKRGRPRKLPVSEGAKPITLPTPALEERPQRSLRLSRDRPVILVKPRGRGRGRGRRVDPDSNLAPEAEPIVETANKFFVSEQKPEEIDPTSSRIKLPRMTEALDKMPSTCLTPLSSRRRNSSTSDIQFFSGETPELKVVLETTLPRMENPFAKSPEVISEFRGRGRGGRGSRGGRGRASPRTPRGRGRGRGGGRGAMYMKETMGIYGRVCGPATTTVQLFEEETCMMDDNATPAKPSHLLDEDSQSSVKSSTNESSKMKKSKFADLFDSNKVWSAEDVKEYTWPPPEQTDADHQVMMIQEQVAMFLGVKSFKRRYPELKRRTITGQERDYVLRQGLVSEALCDLGITAVDASEVLDIMLSDYPHKYEEYRSYQREKQLAEPTPEPVEVKAEVKDRIEMKADTKSLDSKPDLPKIDPEKTRQDMAAAAIASASEWNARMNALRRPACVDLQSLTVQRRRAAPPANPPVRVEPPHGFYPHALLPGQYQHTYRLYTSEQLQYFPLNTAVRAPAAAPSPAPSSSESEPDWASSSDDSEDTHRHQKRKKLSKVKRSSDAEAGGGAEEGEADTCRACKLRIEANRRTTHERFLVCANCNAKLHPSCVELSADTIRKCREYAWQCAECKTCCACARPADDDKMLFCDLCDRGFHIYCVGLDRVPDGRWHCVECAVCKSCGARSPSGPGGPAGPGQGSVTARGPGSPHWHHQTRRGPGGHKLYSHSLCEPCARLR